MLVDGVIPFVAAVVAAVMDDTQPNQVFLVGCNVFAMALGAYRLIPTTIGVDVIASGDGRERIVGHGHLRVLCERQQLADAAARAGLLLQLGG